MNLWDQSIGRLPYRRLEETTLGNLIFMMVAEQKLLVKKTDDQGAEESSNPEFIMFVQGWLDNFPQKIVVNWQAQV